VVATAGVAGGAAGSSAAGSGASGNGGASGASDAGASDVGGTGGGAGGSMGGWPPKGRNGMKSAGCGKDPVGAAPGAFTNHRISLPACAPCTVPNCPRTCIAPPFVPGGVNAQMAANGETLVDRDYTIELPSGYDSTKAYPVFFGADGCGPAPPLKGAGFSVAGEDGAIKVGLQQIGSCFADGGIRCAPDIKNVGACVNGPEIPYFLAVQKWVESNFCVDLGAEFVGGGSSGAWEAMLVGCGAASTMRGFYSLAGGLREHRWACDGPIAAFMIVSDADTLNPVGPLSMLNVIEDTYGAKPSRDEILARNGCLGNTTAPFDAKYPSCVTYTGCPAAYPVVWCEFAGGSHDNPNYNGVNYANAVAPFLLGLPPAP
jgi:poly(3-hydroxybutyrate) depolymerase